MILHHSCFPIDQNNEERHIFKHLPGEIDGRVFSDFLSLKIDNEIECKHLDELVNEGIQI